MLDSTYVNLKRVAIDDSRWPLEDLMFCLCTSAAYKADYCC